MFHIADFISACRAASASADAPAEVFELVQSAVADPASLSAALEARAAGGNDPEILFHSNELTIVAVGLQPGEITIAHDHRMWAVVGVYEGAERNAFFGRSQQGLEPAGERNVTAGQVILLPEDAIHAIENAEDRVLRGIHVYGGDLVAAQRSMWHAETGEEHQFEFSTFESWNSELQRRREGPGQAAS